MALERSPKAKSYRHDEPCSPPFHQSPALEQDILEYWFLVLSAHAHLFLNEEITGPAPLSTVACWSSWRL